METRQFIGVIDELAGAHPAKFAGIAVALELRQSLVQGLPLRRRGFRTTDEIASCNSARRAKSCVRSPALSRGSSSRISALAHGRNLPSQYKFSKLWLPSAAQRLVESDQIRGDGPLRFRSGRPGFGRGSVAPPARAGNRPGRFGRDRGPGPPPVRWLARRAPAIGGGLFLGVGGQRRFHIGEGGEHGLFILCQRLVHARVLHTNVGADAAGVENPPLHGRAGRPKAAAAGKPVAGADALQPNIACQ